jgi:hypothetical protein
MKMITMSMQNRTHHHSRTMNRIGSQEGYNYLIGLSTNYCVQAGCLILKLPLDSLHLHDNIVRTLRTLNVISKSSRCNEAIHYLTDEMKEMLGFFNMSSITTLHLEYE